VSPRADRIIALIAGGLLSLIFVACSAVQVAGWTTGSVESKNHQIIRGPVDELFIDAAGSGDVMLVPARDGDVRVDSRARGTLHTPQLNVDVIGNDVEISGGCSEFSFGNCSATLLVEVPTGTAVRVDAASGDLSAENLTGNITLHTASGDVRARRLNGRLDLDTASGDIDAASVRSNSVRAHSASGDVTVDLALPPGTVDAETSSGDVRIFVPRGREAYDVDVDAGSGDETIDVDPDPGSSRLLRAHTSSGDVEITYRGS
jgi:DUF4097 and DUF4098 domain-containing protein YvlB